MYKFSKYNFVTIEDDKAVLFNLYSGAIIKVPQDLYEDYLTAKLLSDGDLKFFKEMKEQGFIVDSNLDEFQRAHGEVTFEINNVLSSSANFVIAPTMECNLHCFYCFESACEQKMGRMSQKTADDVINFIVSSLKPTIKNLNINWFGGEPLLCFELITYIGNQIKSRLRPDVVFTSKIITNGVLLTKERCLALKEQCNLNSAQITVDGFETNYCKAKGAKRADYQNVIKNIEDCADLIDINVCYNVTKLNSAELYTFADFLLNEKNLKNKIKFYLAQVKNYTNGKFSDLCYSMSEYAKIEEDFVNHLKKQGLNYRKQDGKLSRAHPCGVMRYTDGAIDCEGNLYKCEHFLGQPKLRVGKCETGWFYNSTYRANSECLLNKECKDCIYYPRCGFALCIGQQELLNPNISCAYKPVMQRRTENHLKKIFKGGVNYDGNS